MASISRNASSFLRLSGSLAVLCAAMGSAVMLAGCASRSAEVAAADLTPTTDLASPVVMGGDNGLELRWWIVADSDGARLATALAGYTHLPVSFGASTTSRWRSNGLRVIKAPLADLASIRQALPIVGRVDRHWLGQTPRWTELLQGEPVQDDAQILLGGRPTSMSRGRVRLLARAWTSPTPVGPRLRADLTIQHVPDGDFPLRGVDPMGLARRIPAESRGQVLTELSANTALDPGYVYIIVPEDPARTWLSSGSVGPTPLFDWGELAGPPAPPMPTIGEALLTGGALNDGLPGLRAVVILVPRTPDQFRLLPGDPPAGPAL